MQAKYLGAGSFLVALLSFGSLGSLGCSSTKSDAAGSAGSGGATSNGGALGTPAAGTGGSAMPQGGQSGAGGITYYIGKCVAIPAGGTGLPHGLTVLASDVKASGGLEVNAGYAYFASATSIERLALTGGTPEVMVSGASATAIGIDGSTLEWIDTGVMGKTQILSVPLTAMGWQASANSAAGGAGGAGQVAKVLASVTGAPGAFTVANGYAYFGAGTVVQRVPSAGGAVEIVTTGIAPTGIAVDAMNVYLGDDPNEAIQQAMLGVAGGAPLGGFAVSDATPTQLAVSGGVLYWGDWVGGIEFAPVATPEALGLGSTPCGGGACYPRHVRSGGPGVIWESGDNLCGSVGTTSSTGTAVFAENVLAIQSLAADATHLYASTIAGELLRFDL